jgi:hypothetical protein
MAPREPLRHDCAPQSRPEPCSYRWRTPRTRCAAEPAPDERGRSGHLARRFAAGHHGVMEESDIVIVMEALLDIRARVTDIHTALFGGGDDEEPAMDEDDT